MAYTINPHMGKVRRDAVRLVKYRGWSMRDVAKHVGVEPSTISRWCKHPWATGWHDIPTKSSAPKTHPNALPKEVVVAIIEKRMEHRRCGQVVHHELKKERVAVRCRQCSAPLNVATCSKKGVPGSDRTTRRRDRK